MAEVSPSQPMGAKGARREAADLALLAERAERAALAEADRQGMAALTARPEAEAALGSLMVATEAIRERGPREEVEDHRPNPGQLQALEAQAE